MKCFHLYVQPLSNCVDCNTNKTFIESTSLFGLLFKATLPKLKMPVFFFGMDGMHQLLRFSHV